MLRLVDEKTGKPITIGDLVTTFRGETGNLVGAEPPTTSGSTGRVRVQLVGATGEGSIRSWFSGVIRAKFVNL
jgi:hypothetical protein